MAVVNNKGLIGKIVKVYDNSSEVRLITSKLNKYKISVVITDNDSDYIGVIDGYIKDNNLIKISDILSF